MSRFQAAMTGARLAYVVRALEGTLTREKIKFVETESGRHKDGSKRVTHAMERVPKEVPAGYMVYFPRGHALRLTEKQLKQYNLDKRPKIVNLEGLNDPNSPIGQLLMEQTDEGRVKAFSELEDMVIKITVANSGPIQMPEQLEQMKARSRKRQEQASVAA